METDFTRRIGVRLPIIGAPMAGGPTTPALVAAVSEAGGFGVLSGGYLTPDAFRDAIRQVRARTSRPFGVNLFAPMSYVVDDAKVAATMQLLQPYADELGVELETPRAYGDDGDGLLEVALEEGVRFVSYTFGLLEPARMKSFRDAGVVTCGTATSVAEARAVVDAGADMVCVQSGEAGGHRGGFLGNPMESVVGLVSLVPLVVDAVEVPVIAAGGIMDGRGIAAALTLGASAAQLGTAFLLTPEAGTSSPYRQAVADAAETDTMLITAYSGRAARGIRNRMAIELADADLPPYPVMNALTRPIRRAAAAAGRAEFLSLWAGHGVGATRTLPAAELMAALERETTAALAARP